MNKEVMIKKDENPLHKLKVPLLKFICKQIIYDFIQMH